MKRKSSLTCIKNTMYAPRSNHRVVKLLKFVSASVMMSLLFSFVDNKFVNSFPCLFVINYELWIMIIEKSLCTRGCE